MRDLVSPEILEALDRGLLVLTGNDRLARSVQRAWDQLQVRQGKTIWPPANVLSWRSWTQLLWKSLLLEGRVDALLLSPLQERRVWSKIIDASAPAGSLRTESMANLASAAWHRLCAYQGRQMFEMSFASLQGDPRQFALWARSFQELCSKESLLSGASLEAELRQHLQQKDLDRWSRGLLVLGLDQPTPVQNALIQRSQSLGFPVEVIPHADLGAGVLVSAFNRKEELRGCASWISDRLSESPLARVALIVEDLDKDMDAIESTLREYLSPNLENIAADTFAAPFEFSLGRPLSHEPMVQCALDLVRWASQPLSIEQVSRLLLSPYFAGSAEELSARAAFDVVTLRHDLRLRPEITIESFLLELRSSSKVASSSPVFRQIVEEMRHAQSHFDLRPRSFGEWSEWIRTWLRLARWSTGKMAFTSREYQIRERWEEALDDLASLDFLGEEILFVDVLTTLNRMTRDLIFAPASRDASVQVLGPREAAGEYFDFVWILRAGELDWPPGAASLPLLPKDLQRALAMPGADSKRDRQTAQELTRRLASAGTSIVFSYAQSTPEGGHQRAAAVVRDLHYRTVSLAELTTPYTLNSPVELERSPIEEPISSLLANTHRGGARILELQAACGFRAFAEMRLGSSELRLRAAGLNAMERGNIVHCALETFWLSVGSQRQLLAMADGELADKVDQAVMQSLRGAFQKQVDGWDKAYLDVQQRRLTKLLNEWLAFEMQRPEFTVVAQERRQSVTIGPLHLALRVDRVDLVNGQQVIIDYKTGSATTSEWLSDRPDKPQVPLYAILTREASAQADTAPSPLGAVGFAQVRAGKDLKLRGFESVPGLLTTPGSSARAATMDAESFETQVERWHEVLERLAVEFARGDTRVRPKKYPTTCEHCGQRVLCRVDGSVFEAGMDNLPVDQDDSTDV